MAPLTVSSSCSDPATSMLHAALNGGRREKGRKLNWTVADLPGFNFTGSIGVNVTPTSSSWPFTTPTGSFNWNHVVRFERLIRRTCSEADAPTCRNPKSTDCITDVASSIVAMGFRTPQPLAIGLDFAGWDSESKGNIE